MPVYEYKCRNHGIFPELATLEAAAIPVACPQCGAVSPRIIAIPPAFLDMAPAKRTAMSKNDLARHEPVVSSAADRRASSAESGHRHTSECGCRNRSVLRQQAVFLPDGSKVFPSQRPWMISH